MAAITLSRESLGVANYKHKLPLEDLVRLRGNVRKKSVFIDACQPVDRANDRLRRYVPFCNHSTPPQDDPIAADLLETEEQPLRQNRLRLICFDVL
uniref:SET domain-containing protein n=1 Tax=Steinernema glaseri TaxID=37863 RepID=A0A1I8AGZ5_9BILA